MDLIYCVFAERCSFFLSSSSQCVGVTTTTVESLLKRDNLIRAVMASHLNSDLNFQRYKLIVLKVIWGVERESGGQASQTGE